jgi:DNA-binding transcriptional MerR regulator
VRPSQAGAASAEGRPIPDRLYFRIGDVAELVGVKPYVLRYWESEFPLISPDKSNTGQRVYRRTDVENLMLIKKLLYKERYSIEGARNRIRELRREGELKAARTGSPEAGPDRKERLARLARMKTLARELKALSRVPADELFGL